MKKRVLFINLRSHEIERVEPIYAAKRLGLNIVLLCDSVPDVNKSYFEDIIVMNTFEIENCVKEIIKYNKIKNINGVLTWSDKDVQLVSSIGSALNLPSLSIEASLCVRNKHEMRKKVSDFYPELCPKFHLVQSFEQLEKACKEIGFPAVFKPVGASGSKAIFKIKKEKDLQKIYHMMISASDQNKDKIYSYFPNQYIYEEYLLGEELSIEGIVKNNKVIIAGITDKKITEDYSLEYQEIFPSKFYSEYFELFKDSIEKIVYSLGLNQTSFHAEFKFDKSKKELKLIEIAGRPGGGFISSHLIPISSGISFHEQIIKLAIGEEIDEKLDIKEWYPERLGFAGHLDCLAIKEGTYVSLKGLGKVIEDSRVLITVPTVENGHKIVLPPQNFSSQYVSTSVVRAKTYMETEEILKKIQDTLDIIIEE